LNLKIAAMMATRPAQPGALRRPLVSFIASLDRRVPRLPKGRDLSPEQAYVCGAAFELVKHAVAIRADSHKIVC
jgi:hypothetical protein